MLLEHRDGGVAIDVADDNHGHQVRAVPVAVEPHQLLASRALDGVGVADGRPIRVARPFELHAADSVLRALTRAKVHPPFRQDDAALMVDAALVERGALRPVLEDEERAIEHTGHIGRYAQRVLRIVIARRRIRVRADAQAQRRQEIEEALPRKVPCALELHVFDEMRQPLLVVVFQHRAGLDDEPQLSAVGRLRVCAYVVAQAVRQRAGHDLGIHRHLLRESIGSDRRRGRLAARECRLGGSYQPSGGKHAGKDGTDGDAGAEEGHTSILSDARVR